jgi:hypothetical protein
MLYFVDARDGSEAVCITSARHCCAAVVAAGRPPLTVRGMAASIAAQGGDDMWSVISVNAAAIVLAAVAYGIIKRPFWAAFVAAALVATGLQLFVRELGYMDKLWPIAAVTSFANAFVVGLAVVFAWRYLAKLKTARE